MSNDIQAFEKILEEIKASSVYAETNNKYGAMCVPVGCVERIIHKHMNDGWIPEKEKPPEKKSVLMCDAAGCRDVGWWNGQKWKTGFSHADNFEAIAWMPLPSPYRLTKGDANEQE